MFLLQGFIHEWEVTVTGELGKDHLVYTVMSLIN